MSEERNDSGQGNTIETLRDEMFDAIRKLKSGAIDVAKAQSIATIGDVIIRSARAEIEYMKVAGETNVTSEFLGGKKTPAQVTGTPAGTSMAALPTTRVNRLR